jgi:chromosomal replication initiator protein
MENVTEIWSNILNKLEEHINAQSFKTWFNETTPLGIDGDDIIIKVPTKFAADYLNQNYTILLSEISFALYSRKMDVKFTNNNVKITNIRKSPVIAKKEAVSKFKLNNKYTFDQFVVGKSNNFAHSASMAVAESPGTTYNPLFLYGESGMGKTHLMQAIGNFIAESTDDINVYYTTTENFTNEMIEALQTKSIAAFRNKFRNIDLLLVDDIHFLAKKEGTQEEFFHTFNALYETKKQIVLTSDRPLKDIRDLEKD